jgi:hypothetical protein
MEEGGGRRTDLTTILWTVVVGMPILLWFSYWSIGILFPIFEWFRPKPKKPRQLALAPFMHDLYPYERRWIVPEDEEISEYGESTAELDLQDDEDN